MGVCDPDRDGATIMEMVLRSSRQQNCHLGLEFVLDLTF